MATNPPKRQAPKPNRSVIQWLLDSDPSIRWQAMRDLISAPAEEVAAERAGRHRGRGRATARPPGGRRVVGWRGVEPWMELHNARPVAATRTRS